MVKKCRKRNDRREWISVTDPKRQCVAYRTYRATFRSLRDDSRQKYLLWFFESFFFLFYSTVAFPWFNGTLSTWTIHIFRNGAVTDAGASKAGGEVDHSQRSWPGNAHETVQHPQGLFVIPLTSDPIPVAHFPFFPLISRPVWTPNPSPNSCWIANWKRPWSTLRKSFPQSVQNPVA